MLTEQIDTAIQYGEDLEPRGPDDDNEGDHDNAPDSDDED